MGLRLCLREPWWIGRAEGIVMSCFQAMLCRTLHAKETLPALCIHFMQYRRAEMRMPFDPDRHWSF